MAITYSNIAGAEPSTVTFRAATVVIPRGSTNEQQEIVVLGDPQSSLGVARVINAPALSTEYGLTVRIVSGPSSAADLPVQISGNSTVIQGTSPWIIGGNSTVAPLAGSVWSIQGNSTVFQGGGAWSIQGNSTVSPLAGSTWATRPIQSSAADLQVTATIGTNLQSTSAPSSNSSGLTVRQVIDTILTTSSTNAFASTSFSIQSSGATLRSYVTAYSITSTGQAPNKVCFYSSGVMLWPVVLAALSSAVSGVNLAVSAPAYLFRTIGANDALTLQTGGSTGGGYKVGVSYFRAP